MINPSLDIKIGFHSPPAGGKNIQSPLDIASILEKAGAVPLKQESQSLHASGTTLYSSNPPTVVVGFNPNRPNELLIHKLGLKVIQTKNGLDIQKRDIVGNWKSLGLQLTKLDVFKTADGGLDVIIGARENNNIIRVSAVKEQNASIKTDSDKLVTTPSRFIDASWRDSYQSFLNGLAKYSGLLANGTVTYTERQIISAAVERADKIRNDTIGRILEETRMSAALGATSPSPISI